MSVGVWSRWLIYITAGLVIIGLVWVEVDSAGSVVEAHCQLEDGRVTDRLYLYTDGAAKFDYYGVPLGQGSDGCEICFGGRLDDSSCGTAASAPVLPTEDVIEQWVVSPAVQVSAGELVLVAPIPDPTPHAVTYALDRTVPGSEWRQPPAYLWPGMKELLGVWGMVAAGLGTLAVGCLVVRAMED